MEDAPDHSADCRYRWGHGDRRCPDLDRDEAEDLGDVHLDPLLNERVVVGVDLGRVDAREERYGLVLGVN
jgi:hypothetical protein